MTEDRYKEYTVPVTAENREIIIAWMDFFGFEMILEEAELLKAYFNREHGDGPDVSEMAEKFKINPTSIQVKEIISENWNEKWESNFTPVTIPEKCNIRASFHPPNKAVPFEIVISPKMAFGTGHHETTYMMIEQMFQYDMDGKTVLDYGCGTGILSVFAAMKSAEEVLAIDIEKQSVENTHEHIALNDLDESIFSVHQGDLNIFSGDEAFDFILANINRHVLMRQALSLFKLSARGGTLLLSGILDADYEMVKSHYEGAGFNFVVRNQKADWLCLTFKKDV